MPTQPITFDQFVASANTLNQENFLKQTEHAAQCQHSRPCLAPMLCLPVVAVCLERFFNAGMTPQDALDAMAAKEECINDAMCRVEGY